MQRRRLGQSRRRGQRGYTLIEVLIALIMFTFISLAAGFAMTGALRIQHGAKAKADELQEARTLLAIITRDLRATYASTSNPNTFFTAQSDGQNTSQLMFTTLGNRLVPSGVSGVPDPNAAPALPQSDVGIVAYSFDPDSKSLYRVETAIPSTDALTQLTQSPSPDNLLSNHVVSLSFQFLDPNNPDPQNGWRTDWTYAQDPNQMTQAGDQSGGAGGAGAAGGQGGASAQDNTSAQNSIGAMLASGGQQLDTTLPLTVQVSLVLVNPDGQSSTYTTAVTLPSFNPQPAGQTPDATTTATGGTPTAPGVPGTGGNGGGNGNGGGPRPGGGGGGPRPAPTPGGGGTLPGLGGMGPRP